MWVAKNPPSFALVEREDPRDAADAVRELDGRTLCGCRVRVDLSNGEKRSRNRDRLLLGVVALEMIIRGGVLHLATHLQDGEAAPSARAGPFLDIGEERDPCPRKEIPSRPDLTLGLLADLGQMKGNRRPLCKRSGVQEITSFDRSMYRKFKFCLRLPKLGALLNVLAVHICLSPGTVTHKGVILYGLKWVI